MGLVLQRRSVLKALLGLPALALPSWLFPPRAVISRFVRPLPGSDLVGVVDVYVSDFGEASRRNAVIYHRRSGKTALTEAHMLRVIQDSWQKGGAPTLMRCSDRQYEILKGYR